MSGSIQAGRSWIIVWAIWEWPYCRNHSLLRINLSYLAGRGDIPKLILYLSLSSRFKIDLTVRQGFIFRGRHRASSGFPPPPPGEPITNLIFAPILEIVRPFKKISRCYFTSNYFTHKTKQAYYHSNLCQLNYLVNIESCVATAKRIIPLPPLPHWKLRRKPCVMLPY